MVDQIWAQAAVITWSKRLLDSFLHWTSKELLARDGNVTEQARRLYFAPCVVVSHGLEADSILNYINQAALNLWEMTWEELIRTPSCQTAEPVNQEERARMLRVVEKQGYFDRYRGVRISARGRRFFVEEAIVWNVMDEEGQRIGQAATFSRWTRLP